MNKTQRFRLEAARLASELPRQRFRRDVRCVRRGAEAAQGIRAAAYASHGDGHGKVEIQIGTGVFFGWYSWGMFKGLKGIHHLAMEKSKSKSDLAPSEHPIQSNH